MNTQLVATPAERAKTLAHEQIHFDIGELIARKLRQRLAQCLRTGEDQYDSQVGWDIRKLQAEENTLSNQFDQEAYLVSGHLHEASVRQRWQRRLARELAALTVYKSKPEDCVP